MPTFCRFFFGVLGSPTKIDYRQEGTLIILSSLLEDLGPYPLVGCHEPHLSVAHMDNVEGIWRPEACPLLRVNYASCSATIGSPEGALGREKVCKHQHRPGRRLFCLPFAAFAG